MHGYTLKQMAEVNAFLNKLSAEDFSTRLEIKSKMMIKII